MTNRLPVALDDAAIEDFGRELDAIQREVKASLGEHDRRYIRRMITMKSQIASAGRAATLTPVLGRPSSKPSCMSC